MTGGLIYHANPRDWYVYDGSNWRILESASSSNTFITTSIAGVREQVWGWIKCSGTTSVSLTGGGSQKLGYNKLD
jgi:hypothetical protein